MNIKRDYYLNKLIHKKHNSLIKVITGLRRCGKSYLLFNLFKAHLLNIGIKADHIIEIAFDIQDNQKLLNKDKLMSYILSHIKDNDMYYILLDEIQYIKHFEPVLNQLLRINNVDVYVTGSNSEFLSIDIVTSMRGRMDEVHVYPFTFKEFLQAYDNIEQAWSDFWKYGSMPQILLRNTSQEKDEFLRNLVKITYFNDVLERYSIRHKDVIDKLFNILCSNIGCYLNPNKIANTLKSIEHINIKSSTIYRYIKYFENCFLINKAIKYDIKGRKYIGASEKYYFQDLGLRNAYLSHRQDDKSHIYENIIFNHLIANGYSVDIGLVENRQNNKKEWFEIDFVASKGDKTYYIQSCLTLETNNPEKIKSRELRPFNKTNNSFEKILVIGDKIHSLTNENGIKIINIVDFLLNFN